jgi:hypothetical protein
MNMIENLPKPFSQSEPYAVAADWLDCRLDFDAGSCY